MIPRRRPFRTNDIPAGDNGDRARVSRRNGARGDGVSTAPVKERAYLVGLDHGQNGLMSEEESLRELARLARTAGTVVVGQSVQRRQHPDPATYVGSGKLEEIKDARERTDYSLVVFDEQLSPAQQLRLESALEVKVLDRSALILDIFASRARTREARLQVELAQHEYLLPRLRGQWQHLERMEGAVGLRGPGETQLETDRRLIGQRIARLKREIDAVRRQRALHRRRRTREGVPVIALVGYTNAGKSSLLRTLAGADVLAADTLFATLDPLTRRVGLPGNETVLVTDTVGFIQKLPTQLISAFRATLEELESADLLLHVVDATSPAIEAQWATVMETLNTLGLADRPMLTVLNKADGLTRADGQPVASEADLAHVDIASPAPGAAVVVSATEGWGVDTLRRRLAFEMFGVHPEVTAPA
ncbi:MAG: GTPase HflX [Dehalococcoidia bacterium]